MTSVCSQINCPYSSDRSGCIRYTLNTQLCHLTEIFPGVFKLNQYWLFFKDEHDKDRRIKAIKAANKEFLKNDINYQRDLELLSEGLHIFP